MKVLVIGSGAVGLGIAIAAANAGMDTAIIARSKTAEYIRENGMKRTGLFGELDVKPEEVTVYEDYESVPSGFDYVAVAVKTMANETVAESLASHKGILGDTGRIVLFQNGWGNDEPYLKYFPSSQVFNARVITGFERVEPGVTKVTAHQAPILLGSLHGDSIAELEPLARAINDSGISSEVSEDIAKALWAKMLYNTTLNPLGAILNMSYGELAATEHIVGIMNKLIEETFAVMDAAGYKTFWNDAEEYKEAFFGKLVPDTAAHRASTLQDIEKRQKTEINTLNGCVQRIGSKYGVPTPTHDMIVEMIKGIEDIRC